LAFDSRCRDRNDAVICSLSFHANYACRHSGACCTAGWAIPVEARLLPLLGVKVLVPDDQGACGHFDRKSRLCVVQREYGEEMLPGSCYQFPRRALLDDRGTFITLSNFCPTAATLLCESEAALAIVASPPAFPEGRVYEGLDARGQWPPLVRPGLLFDFESYGRWEAFIVSTLAGDAPVANQLAQIANAAERLRRWTPAGGAFAEWVIRTLDTATADPTALQLYRAIRTTDTYDALRRFVLVPPQPRERVLATFGAPSTPGRALSSSPLHDWNGEARAVRRYLASKAFASWSAYESRGVRTLVAELLVAEVVLRAECERASEAAGRPIDRALMIEAIRQSDLLLVHLIDRPQMIEWLGQIEAR
jgi:hypothetical protein